MNTKPTAGAATGAHPKTGTKPTEHSSITRTIREVAETNPPTAPGEPGADSRPSPAGAVPQRCERCGQEVLSLGVHAAGCPGLLIPAKWQDGVNHITGFWLVTCPTCRSTIQLKSHRGFWHCDKLWSQGIGYRILNDLRDDTRLFLEGPNEAI